MNSFAEPVAQAGRRAVKRHVAGETDADLVAAAIEEVIYRLDTRGEIPAAVAALRRKLGVPGLIEAVYGKGFRLGGV